MRTVHPLYPCYACPSTTSLLKAVPALCASPPFAQPDETLLVLDGTTGLNMLNQVGVRQTVRKPGAVCGWECIMG